MEAKKTVREFVITELVEDGSQGDLSDDTSLIDSGILDSLSILRLISFLDDNFGIIPGEGDLDPSNFDTIDLIEEFINQRLGR